MDFAGRNVRLRPVRPHYISKLFWEDFARMPRAPRVMAGPRPHRENRKKRMSTENARPPPGMPAGALELSRKREIYQSSRTTVRVLIGSFIAASLSASRATASLTPSISNMIRPGLTLAAQ